MSATRPNTFKSIPWKYVYSWHSTKQAWVTWDGEDKKQVTIPGFNWVILEADTYRYEGVYSGKKVYTPLIKGNPITTLRSKLNANLHTGRALDDDTKRMFKSYQASYNKYVFCVQLDPNGDANNDKIFAIKLKGKMLFKWIELMNQYPNQDLAFLLLQADGTFTWDEKPDGSPITVGNFKLLKLSDKKLAEIKDRVCAKDEILQEYLDLKTTNDLEQDEEETDVQADLPHPPDEQASNQPASNPEPPKKGKNPNQTPPDVDQVSDDDLPF